MPRPLTVLTTAVAASALAAAGATLAPASASPAHHLTQQRARGVYNRLVDAVNDGSRGRALKVATRPVVRRMLAVHANGEDASFGHATSCTIHPHTAVCHGTVFEDEDVLHVVVTISATTHRATSFSS